MTILAVLYSCSPDSIAHGPAITVKLPPPTGIFPILTTVSLGYNSLLTSLYGDKIGVTLSTIGWFSRWSCAIFRSSPIAPITVRSMPGIYSGFNSRDAICSSISSASDCAASCLSKIIIFIYRNHVLLSKN